MVMLTVCCSFVVTGALVALTDHKKYRHSPRFNPQATKLVCIGGIE